MERFQFSHQNSISLEHHILAMQEVIKECIYLCYLYSALSYEDHLHPDAIHGLIFLSTIIPFLIHMHNVSHIYESWLTVYSIWIYHRSTEP